MKKYANSQAPFQVHTIPGPVKIVTPVEEDHSFVLNETSLAKILLDPKYVDKKVCKVS